MTVRAQPSVLHVDLDAFFAAVEQRDKPSLRGRPVVVGGTGPRGVVATASYEARRYGIRSAMSGAEARARCHHAAFLAGRFAAYRGASDVVMGVLRELSPLVEPLSLDEAFVDLDASAAGPPAEPSSVREVAERLRAEVWRRTGLAASVGAATSKLVAKIASELAKPDGVQVVEPGTELGLLHPMPVRSLWGVGPATADRLTRAGARTVGELSRFPEPELVDLLGQAHGRALHRLSHGVDDRPVEPHRETKSVSVEDTFERDVVDGVLLGAIATRMSARVCARLRSDRLSGRTVSVKVRLPDFTTLSRSQTLPGPTDDERVVAPVARRLLSEVDTRTGVRLLGVGVSGLADWVQEDLFADDEPATDAGADGDLEAAVHRVRPWVPGQDVEHTEHGRGWVWGGGRGLVTVRFE
ncbi:MAG TPA: DNA polymerase IV, partial [Jiangellales bacterium]|nr:DNA polymerase IV [Jiangellales bacterium]